MLEHFLHVNARWLRLERVYRAERVLRSPEAVVWRSRLVLDVGATLLERNWHLIVVVGLLVEVLGSRIAVVDEALAPVYGDVVSNEEVLRSVELLLLQGHARAVCLDWLLGELLPLQEHREGCLAAVLLVEFLHFN